jgi:hypothetical protein
MTVFITYARKDREVVRQLRADIGQLGHPVWLDEEMTGGHQWWSTILRQIRECTVYVFALSPESLRSRACLSELRYAEVLGRPILPIMVRPVAANTAPAVLANTQIVDYANRTPDTVLGLLRAFNALPSARPLPSPLPPEPPIPTSYLNAYLEQLNANELTLTAQVELFVQLRGRLDEEDDRAAVWDLLVRLRNRRDLAQSLVADLNEVLAPGWKFDPQERFDGRYWDGHAWTSRVWHDGVERDERQPHREATMQPPVPVHTPVRPAPRTSGRGLSGRMVGFLVAGATLLIGGVVLLVVLLSGGASGDPEAAARAFIDAANSRDTSAAAEVVCERDRSQLLNSPDDEGQFSASLENVDAEGDSGTFTFIAEEPLSGERVRITMQLITEDGQWRVCDLATPQVQPVP